MRLGGRRKESKLEAEASCLRSLLIQSTRLEGLEGDTTFILIHASHFADSLSCRTLLGFRYYGLGWC